MTSPTRAVISGHSRGLGAAIAENLLARGIAVLGLARQGNPALAAAYPQLLQEAALDLADDAALAAWCDGGRMAEFLSGCHRGLLINNAGTVQPVAAPGHQGATAIARAVALNVAAPLMLADAFAALPLAERRLLHISSGAARSPYAGWSVYCATKAALDMHARAVAADALPGLSIVSLAPGVIDTDMQAEVRACDTQAFPLRDRFLALKREGQLSSPAACAERLVSHLLSADFGTSPVQDLREL
ncbi:MAG TPA: SDR family oxidoreductase [Rhodocyclaceae bacterium]